MKLALKDNNSKIMHRCPDCGEYTMGMTVIHPWRLYCPKCKQELQNPDHPEYYPKDIASQAEGSHDQDRPETA